MDIKRKYVFLVYKYICIVKYVHKDKQTKIAFLTNNEKRKPQFIIIKSDSHSLSEMFATPKGPCKIIIECMQLKPRYDMHIYLPSKKKKKKKEERKQIFEERGGGRSNGTRWMLLLGEVRERKREARGKSVFQDTMITWGLGEAESAGVENSHGEGKKGNNMEERGGFLTEPKEPPSL